MLSARKLLGASVCLKGKQPVIYHLSVLCAAQNGSKQHNQSPQTGMAHRSAMRFVHTTMQTVRPGRFFDNKSDLSRFLLEVGTDPKEARYWLKNFSATADQTEIFMIIGIQNDVLENHALMETFSSTVSFLHRNGISPLIVLSNKPDRCFKTMKDNSILNAIKLSDMIEDHGSFVRMMYPGSGVVVGSEPRASDTECHFTIMTDQIHRSQATKHLPILLSFGETPQGQMFPVNAWDLTVQLSRIFQPKKVMVVNSHGGFLDKQGKVIGNINLPSDLNLINQKPWATAQIVDTMTKVNKLLIDLPTESSVVITSADTVLRELFSHRGSGTFFRATEAIHKYTTLKGIDLDMLRVLLNRSFMVEVLDTYFDSISDQIHAIYLSESYSGVAIVLRCEELGVPYLCKFAVTSKAQGLGTGEMLWDALITNEPSLFWRSKTINPINTWYFRKCQGSWHNPLWTVFWYGIHDPDKSSSVITNAISRKDSFKRRGIANIVSDDEEERIGG